METLENIRTRRSIRKFTDEPVDHATLEKIVEAASWSPSWKNTQIVRYIAIEDPALKAKIAKDCTTGFTYNAGTMDSAPMLIAVCVVKGRCGFERDGSYTTSRKDTWQMFDAGIASQTFCLAAHEYGLGTVIMGIFDDTLPGVLEIPEEQELVNIICIGHPAEEPEMPKRKSVSDLLSYK
ncbi:MAG: nitroreductase family protein [Lachnospiraceae bacterium]|jgi:nitroreductase|nr:nitroreductase family protein [Lachnospiraceae bacterium]